MLRSLFLLHFLYEKLYRFGIGFIMRFIWILCGNAGLNKLFWEFIRTEMALLLGLRGISDLFLGLFYLELGVELG